MQERRGHPRFPLILAVEYGDESRVLDYTENLSADGIFIRTERDFELGDRIPLVVSFPQLLEPMELEVEVTWKASPGAGEGSGVGVRVPLDRPDHRARLAELARRAASTRGVSGPTFRILLAEDNSLVASMYSAALQRLSDEDQNALAIAVAHDGEEALALLKGGPPADLLVTDVFMPGRSGVELVRAVRADPALAELPVIVISSGGDAERQELERLGVGLFLRKPVKYQDLVATVRALLPATLGARAAAGGRSPARPRASS